MRITFPNPLGPPISIDTSHISSLQSRLPHFLTSSRKTPFRILLLLLLVIVVLTYRPVPPFPPDYSEEWRRERNLPWLYRNMPFPEGKDGRYLKFDIPEATGFNSQIQRILLQHHLAVLSNRSFAYEPLVQDETSLPFKLGFPPWRSAKVPLSALISTAISGFERSVYSPRAVPDSFFRSVCPSYRHKVYHLKDADHPEGNLEVSREGQERMHQLQVLFAGSDERCLRVEGKVFDDAFFDSQAPLNMYESFAHSPVLQHFTFSPTVLAILNANLDQLAPESDPYDLARFGRAASSETVQFGQQWKHILALHLRRGSDWEEVCDEKGRRAAPFVGFNKLPNLPGNENVPPPDSMGEPARMGLYRAKCLPTTLDIIARARRMKRNHPFLRAVYLLTDGEDDYSDEIRMWLLSEGWEHVWVGRRDVWPRAQDREVGVGVDMEVARRSGVFVGNGFSTTSSNIVLLRSRDGIHPDLTQFW